MYINVDSREANERLEALLRNLDDVPESVRLDFEKGMQDMVDIAKGLCPVDKGNLRESIHYEGEFPEFTLIADAVNDQGDYYATYIEFGTSKMPAQPFMWPAVDAAVMDIVPTMYMHIRQSLESS